MEFLVIPTIARKKEGRVFFNQVRDFEGRLITYEYLTETPVHQNDPYYQRFKYENAIFDAREEREKRIKESKS